MPAVLIADILDSLWPISGRRGTNATGEKSETGLAFCLCESRHLHTTLHSHL